MSSTLKYSITIKYHNNLTFIREKGNKKEIGYLPIVSFGVWTALKETLMRASSFAAYRLVYQRYCKVMKELSLVIMELLAISLGVDRLHFRRFFEDGSSIMRCNYYPPCKEHDRVLGTGPHCDPTSITILHQDEVGGLEVFSGNEWQAVRPRPDAFVINIGDTFMVWFCFSKNLKACLIY